MDGRAAARGQQRGCLRGRNKETRQIELLLLLLLLLLTPPSMTMTTMTAIPDGAWTVSDDGRQSATGIRLTAHRRALRG
jgi:hypothetical protein